MGPFIPLLWTWVLILFCLQQNNFFVPVHIPGKLNVVADQGFPSGSHFHRVDVGSRALRIFLPRTSNFPDSGPPLLEGHLQALLFCFSLSGSTGFFIRMPWIPFWIKYFSLQFCLPSSGTHAFLFKRMVRFRGAMLRIVPLNLNSTWILIPAFPGGSFFSSSLCVKR